MSLEFSTASIAAVRGALAESGARLDGRAPFDERKLQLHFRRERADDSSGLASSSASTGGVAAEACVEAVSQ